MGGRVVDRHADGVTCEFTIRPEYLNSHGVLHGGIIATIADETAWYAVDHHSGRGKDYTTSELKINYLLPITGEKVTARAVLVRAGRRLCVSRVDITGEGPALAALGIVTYILIDPKR